MKSYPIIDLHQDIALNILYATQKDFGIKNTLHQGESPIGLAVNNNVDLPRLREGKVKVVFAALFGVSDADLESIASEENYNFDPLTRLKTNLPGVFVQLGLYYQLLQDYSTNLKLIRSWDDYTEVMASDQIGIILHLEGLDFTEGDTDIVTSLISLGIRSIALTWRRRNHFASGNNVDGGLSDAGRCLVECLYDKGIILDLAHANDQTFFDVCEVVTGPFIVSHTLCRALHHNSRNISDEQIKLVAENGGLVGLGPITSYMGGTTLEDYLAHFLHVYSLVGADYIAFGTDFDGMVDERDNFIDGFEDVSGFPRLVQGLRDAGLSERVLEKICYKNIERVLGGRLKRQ